jgi:hypothetical protein
MVDWGCEASGRASRFARDAFFFARAVDGEWAVQYFPRLLAVKSPQVTHLRSDGIAVDDQSGSESSRYERGAANIRSFFFTKENKLGSAVERVSSKTAGEGGM